MTKNKSHSKTKSSKNPLPWIAGAILVLGMAIMAGLYWNSTLTVQKIQFSGNHFVSTADLKKVEVPAGVNPDSMDFGQIRSRFEQIPYVKQSDISVQPNGNLMVRITERQPIALLADGSQKVYVDQDGLRLPIKLGNTVDVPILYGFKASPVNDTLQTEAFKTATNFLTTAHGSKASDATISEVAWTKNEGIVALTNKNGVKLIFGKGDFDNRLRNWEAFYGEVVKKKGIESMRTIDLRFKGQVVTREK